MFIIQDLLLRIMIVKMIQVPTFLEAGKDNNAITDLPDLFTSKEY